MKLIIGKDVYDTETSEVIYEEICDEHPRKTVYRTPTGEFFMTQSTSSFSVAWRWHDQINILTKEQAEEYIEEAEE